MEHRWGAAGATIEMQWSIVGAVMELQWSIAGRLPVLQWSIDGGVGVAMENRWAAGATMEHRRCCDDGLLRSDHQRSDE